MEVRVHKLLIMVGEESVDLEARDFKKLSDVLAGEYLRQNTENFRTYFLEFFPKVIRSIPLKSHFYAGLTAEIARNDSNFAGKILQTVSERLQKDLSEGYYHEVLNTLCYFTQMMNISFLNSLNFMNLLQDLLLSAQKNVQKSIKKCVISVLVQLLPLYAASLNEKTSHEFKRYISKLLNNSSEQQLCNLVHSQYVKDKLVSFSATPRLNADFSTIPQYPGKIRINISLGLPNNLLYYLQNKQHMNIQNWLIRYWIQNLILAFSDDKSVLVLKFNNLMKWKSQNQIPNVVQFLCNRSISSKKPIVQASLLLALKQTLQGSNKIIQQYLLDLFNKFQSLEFPQLQALSDLFSFIINNWGVPEFDWSIFQWTSTQNFIKRRVILQLILQKLALINDKFVFPQNLSQFAPPRPEFVQQIFSGAELQLYNYFNDQLQKKVDSSGVLPQIISQRRYEIFLQALFRRTSKSQKHLQVLEQRYHYALQKCSEWDWDLINKIRNFFRNSYLHRLFYLRYMISKQVLKFGSYVTYVGNLKNKNEVQMTWIKMQIAQLYNQFGKNMKSTK